MAASDSQDSFLTTPHLNTDGIDLQRPHLRRENTVQAILQTARNGQHVVLCSAAATGKTSLLQLLRQRLKLEGANAKRIFLRDFDSKKDFLTD